MKRAGFTTRQLAALKLPGAPGSHQGWDKHAVTHGWEILEHAGRGRGGIVRELIPPAPIAALIARHQAGGKVTADEVRVAMGKTSRGSAMPQSGATGSRKTMPDRKSADHFTQARFSAWLMGRVLNRKERVPAAETLQLDRHELTLRILTLIVERDGRRLQDLQYDTEIVDRAIDLAIAARPVVSGK